MTPGKIGLRVSITGRLNERRLLAPIRAARSLADSRGGASDQQPPAIRRSGGLLKIAPSHPAQFASLLVAIDFQFYTYPSRNPCLLAPEAQAAPPPHAPTLHSSALCLPPRGIRLH